MTTDIALRPSKNSSRHLGWKVMDGAPKCKKQFPVIWSKVIREGYWTHRHGKRVYVQEKVEPYQDKMIVRVCEGKMDMDESWKPSPDMDSWITKWVCRECKAVEYINRAVLPLNCGGLR